MKLDIRTAREMYNSNIPSIKQFALDNYSEDQLISKELPKTWINIDSTKGYFIDSISRIIEHTEVSSEYGLGRLSRNRNVFPTKSLAEAALAQTQLLRLRDIYNEGWTPDWESKETKYSIAVLSNYVGFYDSQHLQYTMTFKSSELRDQFFTNFRDLLETAKSLL